MSGSSTDEYRFYPDVALEDHRGPVTCLASCGDGSLVSGGADPDLAVRFWRPSTGGNRNGGNGGNGGNALKVASEMHGHEGLITAVECVEPRGDRIVSAGFGDGSALRVWHAGTGRRVGELVPRGGAPAGPNDTVFALASLGGDKVAAAGTDCIVRVWDCSRGVAVCNFGGLDLEQPRDSPAGASAAINTLAVGGDGSSPLIFAAGTGGVIRGWDPRAPGTPALVCVSSKGPGVAINALAINGAATAIASGGTDAKVSVWELSRGKRVVVIKGPADAAITSLLCMPNAHLISGSSDGSIIAWDVANAVAQATRRLNAGIHAIVHNGDDGIWVASHDPAILGFTLHDHSGGGYDGGGLVGGDGGGVGG